MSASPPAPPRTPADLSGPRGGERGRIQRVHRGLWAWLVLPSLVLLLAKAFLLGVFVVPSGSMQHTLEVGDRIAVPQAGWTPARGQVIVFDGAGSFEPARATGGALDRISHQVRLAANLDDRTLYVKRVIGLPGDVILCCKHGQVMRGPSEAALVPVEEPYLFADDEAPFGPVTVPDGHLFVLGDHRGDSADSRAHLDGPGGGFVPVDAVVGPVRFVLWPLHRAGPVR